MKKTVTVIGAVTMLLTLAHCGQQSGTPSSNSKATARRAAFKQKPNSHKSAGGSTTAQDQSSDSTTDADQSTRTAPSASGATTTQMHNLNFTKNLITEVNTTKENNLSEIQVRSINTKADLDKLLLTSTSTSSPTAAAQVAHYFKVSEGAAQDQAIEFTKIVDASDAKARARSTQLAALTINKEIGCTPDQMTQLGLDPATVVSGLADLNQAATKVSAPATSASEEGSSDAVVQLIQGNKIVLCIDGTGERLPRVKGELRLEASEIVLVNSKLAAYGMGTLTMLANTLTLVGSNLMLVNSDLSSDSTAKNFNVEFNIDKLVTKNPQDSTVGLFVGVGNFKALGARLTPSGNSNHASTTSPNVQASPNPQPAPVKPAAAMTI